MSRSSIISLVFLVFTASSSILAEKENAQKKTTFIMLEGVSGAGKSSLSSILERDLQLPVIPEPVDQWINVKGSGLNIMEAMHQDLHRWGFTFQTYAFLTNIRASLQAGKKYPGKSIFITDRSAFSGVYTFARMMYKNNILTDLEYAIYQELTDWLLSEFPHAIPDGFVYVRTTPDVCRNRVLKRNRDNEDEALNIDFLTKLYDAHEDWLINKKDINPRLASVPVLVLDGNRDFLHDPQIQKEFVDAIKVFIEQLEQQKK